MGDYESNRGNNMSNPTGNALATQTEQRSLVESIKTEKFQAQIRASLPPSVSLDKFTAVTIAAVNHNPDLLNADRQSFYNAVVKSAQEGLLPDGQDAILNIYNTNIAPRGQPEKWVKKVQFQRMVGGVIKQFKKVGIDAYACCVYANERFRLWNDETGQHITHEPEPFGDKGAMIGVYAVAPMPGKCVIATMGLEDIERARNSSKSPDKGPWKAWYDRMAEKSALHRLRKRVAIIDEEAAKELSKIDDEFDEDEEKTPSEPPKQHVPTGNETRPKALQSVVDQGTGEIVDKPPPADGGDPGPQDGDII
jgi:phage RecT family recombinase